MSMKNRLNFELLKTEINDNVDKVHNSSLLE